MAKRGSAGDSRARRYPPDYPDDPRELARAIFRAGDAKRREKKRKAEKRGR